MYWNTTGNPTTGSNLYTGPITLTESETIYALAVATDYINSAIASAAFVITAPLVGIGFAPNWLIQNTGGLAIYVSPGRINGISVNGQTIAMPPNSSTYVWITEEGNFGTGVSLPAGVLPIALVESGTVYTGTPNLPNNSSPGILAITDLRT